MQLMKLKIILNMFFLSEGLAGNSCQPVRIFNWLSCNQASAVWLDHSASNKHVIDNAVGQARY